MRRIRAFGLGVLALLASAPAFAKDTVYYVHTDPLGSVVMITDANRNVVERTEYAPYGQVLNRPEHDGPGYTGHEEDAATGLTNMKARYDDKVIGRMLSTDPVDVDTGTGANFNRYAYAADNPYRFTDPSGMAPTQPVAASSDTCGPSGACARDQGQTQQEFNKQAVQQSRHESMAAMHEVGVTTAWVNPSKSDIQKQIFADAKTNNVPARAINSLVQTESDFQQFTDGRTNTSATGAVGLTQILKSTASLYGADFDRLKIDWKYNLATGVKIYAWGYNHPFNSNIGDLEIRAARAYDMYHGSSAVPYGQYIRQLKSTNGLLGSPWERSYINNYENQNQ